MREVNDSGKINGESGRARRFGAKRTHNRAFCCLCRAQINLVTFEQAANFAKTSRREILQLAERGLIHRIHNSGGEIMICFNSLQTAEKYFLDTKPLDVAVLFDLHKTRG